MSLLTKRLNGRTAASVPRSLLDEAFGFSPLNSFSNDIEIMNTEEGFVVEIPAPGFKPGEIEVTLDKHVLSIIGKNERRKMSRSILVPEDIDDENIDIQADCGMLTISLKTHPRAMPKKLQVRYNE